MNRVNSFSFVQRDDMPPAAGDFSATLAGFMDQRPLRSFQRHQLRSFPVGMNGVVGCMYSLASVVDGRALTRLSDHLMNRKNLER